MYLKVLWDAPILLCTFYIKGTTKIKNHFIRLIFSFPKLLPNSLMKWISAVTIKVLIVSSIPAGNIFWSSFIKFDKILTSEVF